MTYKSASWLDQSGDLTIITNSQAELCRTKASKQILMQFGIFKAAGNPKAEEIRKNVNRALQMAYERDTFTTEKPPDEISDFFGI